MYTLYVFPPSQNAVRPEIALHEKGVKFERVELDLLQGEHRKPPLCELTPRSQVPTLVRNEDQLVVYESIATIRFIDDMHPTPALMPPISQPRERAAALMRLEEFQAKLDPKNIFGSVAFRRMDREQLKDRINALMGELPHWDEYLTDGDYLAGERFTLADIAVFPLLMHFEALGYDFATHTPRLAAYIARCKSRESIVKTGWLQTFSKFTESLALKRVLSA